jgi:lipid-A-disaccharide synthase-like uncharacterized protein
MGARCSARPLGSPILRTMINESLFRQYVEPVVPWLYADSTLWTCVGLTGGLLFSSRFVLQWIHSERKGRLVVPAAFWYLSFWGSLISLVYAIHLDKLPIILSYVFLPALYGRNLWILRRERESN